MVKYAVLALVFVPFAAQAAAPAAAAPAAAAPISAAAPTAAAAFTLDTPIEAIAANAAGKAVLDADLPGLTTNERYEMIKTISLTQLAGYAPDRLTPERLAKVSADLAAIK